MNRALTVLSICIVVVASGCIPVRTGDTLHYVIIGAGVVSVSDTNRNVARVSTATSVGIMATERGVKIGYGAESVVAIKTNENVSVEVERRPFGPMSVKTPETN